MRAKKPTARPLIIAPITLVAAKVIPSKIIENNIVPKIPIIAVKIVVMLHQEQLNL